MSNDRPLYYKIELLPQPSILQKIELHSQGAAAEIMGRAEALQQKQFRKEERRLQQRLQEFSKKGFISSLFRALSKKAESVSSLYRDLSKEAKSPPLANTAEEFIEQNFSSVGNYMRQAMREYIVDHKINLADLGLTSKEKFDLSITDNQFLKTHHKTDASRYTP